MDASMENVCQLYAVLLEITPLPLKTTGLYAKATRMVLNPSLIFINHG
jgi:hypothetical protein